MVECNDTCYTAIHTKARVTFQKRRNPLDVWQVSMFVAGAAGV